VDLATKLLDCLLFHANVTAVVVAENPRLSRESRGFLFSAADAARQRVEREQRRVAGAGHARASRSSSELRRRISA